MISPPLFLRARGISLLINGLNLPDISVGQGVPNTGTTVATYIVTDETIVSPQAEAYFFRADRRVMIGLRATLEMLGLPVPEYAKRRKSGPTPAKAVLNAYYGDNPKARNYALAPRKENASVEAAAIVNNAQAERLRPNTL